MIAERKHSIYSALIIFEDCCFNLGRKALLRLKPLVDEGGYVPIPDHRIVPDCSWEQFKTHIRIYREIFG